MKKEEYRQIKKIIDEATQKLSAVNPKIKAFLEQGGNQLMMEKVKGLLKKDHNFSSSLCKSIGIVPMNYNPDYFVKKIIINRNNLSWDKLEVEDFPQPTDQLVPGRSYYYKIFKALKHVSYEDCIGFMRKQKNILFTGLPGLFLVDVEDLPKNGRLFSFDKTERLLAEKEEGDVLIPRAHRVLDNLDFEFGYQNDGLPRGFFILCVYEMEENIRE